MVSSADRVSLDRAGDSLQPSQPLSEGLPRSGVRPAVEKPCGKLGFATVPTLFVLRMNKLRAGVFTSVSMPPLKVFLQRNRKVNHIFKLVLIVTGRLSELFQDHLFPLNLYYKIFLELDGARKIIIFFFWSFTTCTLCQDDFEANLTLSSVSSWLSCSASCDMLKRWALNRGWQTSDEHAGVCNL